MLYQFEFNPFSENTYIVADPATRACIIIDPGCYTPDEQQALQQFIMQEGLRPVRIINTHCHLDHVFGNAFVARTWGIGLEIHRGELPVLERFMDVCAQYGIPEVTPSPEPDRFIEPGEIIELGSQHLEVLFTPGHSPASISLYNAAEGYVIAGDVLFFESIGRTDLPGGNHALLLKTIVNELFTLPPETIVYSGHGPTTTIRHEQEYNPFL
jgi:hydroxyacylglutathione hydrolase